MTSNDPNDPRLNWAALSQAERDAAYARHCREMMTNKALAKI